LGLKKFKRFIVLTEIAQEGLYYVTTLDWLFCDDCKFASVETSQLLGSVETAMLDKQFNDVIAVPIGWELNKGGCHSISVQG